MFHPPRHYAFPMAGAVACRQVYLRLLVSNYLVIGEDHLLELCCQRYDLQTDWWGSITFDSSPRREKFLIEIRVKLLGWGLCTPFYFKLLQHMVGFCHVIGPTLLRTKFCAHRFFYSFTTSDGSMRSAADHVVSPRSIMVHNGFKSNEARRERKNEYRLYQAA